MPEKQTTQSKKWEKDLNRRFSEKDMQMADKHMKRYSTLLIIREMQNTTTRSYHLTLIRIVIIKSLQTINAGEKCGEKGTLLHYWWECKLIQPLWKMVWRFLLEKTRNKTTISSVQFSHSVVSDSLRPHELQHARPPCPSPTPRVHSNSRPSPTPGVHSNSHPLSWWCHPAISSSVVPFSSCPQSLPASESFPMSQLFTWGSQSIALSTLASFLPKNTQGWSPLEWTGWISLQSKGLSRVFSNTTVQKHQFFASGGHSTGVSALTSVLPMNTQDWSPLGWTGWISLQS